MSHYCSWKLLFIISGVSLPIMWSVRVFWGVSLPLTRVVLYHNKWLISAHLDSSVSFQVFDCGSYRLLCTFLSVLLQLTKNAVLCQESYCYSLDIYIFSYVPLPLTGMVQCHSLFLSSTQLGGLVLFQVFHTAPCGWCASFQVYHCLFLE